MIEKKQKNAYVYTVHALSCVTQALKLESVEAIDDVESLKKDLGNSFPWILGASRRLPPDAGGGGGMDIDKYKQVLPPGQQRRH